MPLCKRRDSLGKKTSPPTGGTPHRDLFRCVPRFSDDFDGLLFDRKDLDTELNASDPVLVSYLQAFIDQMYSRTHATASDEVRQVLMSLLPSGRSQADAVATSMGIDQRKLNRRLSREGTNFSQVLVKVRRELIEAHLASRRSFGKVAELVGLSSRSSLSHWLARHGKRALGPR